VNSSRKPLLTGFTLVAAIALLASTLHVHRVVSRDHPVVTNTSVETTRIHSEQLANRWIVSPSEAAYLIEQGAVVLDVRDRSAQKRGMIEGAIAVTWQQFSRMDPPYQGHLLVDEGTLAEELRNVGISTHRAVVVVGDPLNGWGEDGRIVWMLRTLGHAQAVFVDGGHAALIKAGVPAQQPLSHSPVTPGDFTIQRTATWEINQDALRSALDSGHLVILDTREPREFEGATPYGEERGGHVPGAIALHYRELLDAEGRLLPREQILGLLRDRQIPPDAVIVSYCTGGVRSAWLTAVLVNLGFQAQNYAGSMWEWSAGSPNLYPLVHP